MTMTEIIDCDGRYEVHPMADGANWAVVNGHTGRVRSEFANKAEAVACAKSMNEIETATKRKP